jgi:hypothetical protein
LTVEDKKEFVKALEFIHVPGDEGNSAESIASDISDLKTRKWKSKKSLEGLVSELQDMRSRLYIELSKVSITSDVRMNIWKRKLKQL